MTENALSPAASPNSGKLKAKLRELFELDKADLDFGIYRILRQRHDQITEFLDKHLEQTVREALQSHGSFRQSRIEGELRKAEEAAREAGFDPEQSPKVKQLRASLDAGATPDATADEVYSHLLKFFSRYYQEGDFLGLRRATVQGREKYMVPYNGEEVKLVWANMDQYYIKSSELLRDYAFRLRQSDLTAGRFDFGDDPEEELVVHFKLVEGDTEKDNRKQNAKTARAFTLDAERPFEEVNATTLNIRFRYRRQQAERDLQKKLNEDAERTLAANLPPRWKALLLAGDPAYAGKDRRDARTVLQKHLRAYTAKFQFDYFIHKDLGGFLRRELDFYIKNEVMHLDDLEGMAAPRADEYLSKIRALRRCATPIIRMLEQLENFQKKLWLKKKFVVETRYCLTLGHVPESLYAEVCANDAQWAEWGQLYAISETEPDLLRPQAQDRRPAFLKANPSLVLDTRHFGREFTSRVLASIDNLDERLDGVCFHGENFQALRLMSERFGGRVQTVYIDPPFNLGANGEFLYKTDYKDSSWACLLTDRLIAAKAVIDDTGFVFVRCDINGNFIARPVLSSIFGEDNFHAELLVQRIRKNVTGQGKLTMPLANDSLFLYQRSPLSELVFPFVRLKESRQSYWRRIDDSAGYRNPPERYVFGRRLLPYKTDAHFKFSQKKMDEMSAQGKIRLRCRACGYEHYRGGWQSCPACGADDPVAQYLVEETDVKILDTNWLDIAGYAHTTGFATENAEVLLHRAIEATSRRGQWVLDFFAGSGTTAAAALKTGRRFLVVEGGDHFESVLLPRLKRVESELRRNAGPSTEAEAPRGLFKIVRLESYEDTLNNLRLHRTPEQEAALRRADDSQRAEYLINYFLDIESAGSASLLNVARFKDPFGYRMHIATASAGETKETPLDLVETFNWLIGLKVNHLDAREGFLTVTGEQRGGARTLVIWRTLSGDPPSDGEALQKHLSELEVDPADTDLDFIYVNGSHTIHDPGNKIHLIEEEFQRRMFESEGFESLG